LQRKGHGNKINETADIYMFMLINSDGGNRVTTNRATKESNFLPPSHPLPWTIFRDA